jgi:phage replication-related protein YjqB (UPF0714/DUF867 family)
MPQSEDNYASYVELAMHEIEGQDYVLIARRSSSPVAVIAPHGGGIEAGTADLANAIAGPEHSLYAFKGIKPRGNAILHITSHRFDEPTGMRIAQGAEVVVTLHGHRDRAQEVVYIGGRHEGLSEGIRQLLIRAGFRAEISTSPGLQALHRHNICNRCRTGRGVQLEITRALREKMFSYLSRRPNRSKTTHFYRFVNALRAALQ